MPHPFDARALWRRKATAPGGPRRTPTHRGTGFARRRAGWLLLPAFAMLLAGGCGGGGGDGRAEPGISGTPAPAGSNPVDLTFRPTDLGARAERDGVNYRTPEFMGHHGLAAISADAAYQRGYFGQDVTIAVADDGMDTTHPDLAGKIRAPLHVVNGNANVFEPDQRDQGTGHGTYVALLAAGARDNDHGQTFEIKVAGGAPILTGNVHGVAPRASVIPIQLTGGALPPAAIRHAVANGAQVLNFSIGFATSYFGEYTGRDGIWLTTPLPLFGPLIDSLTKRSFGTVAAAVENADIVVVWAAGNDGWNSLTNGLRMCGKNFAGEDGCLLGEGPVSAVEFMQNFTWLSDDRKISFKEMWGTDCGSDDCADYNSPGEWKEAPLFEPRLLGKWLVAGAMDENDEISRFSNGCGATRNWCLMAPGEDLTVGGKAISGTSFAAPIVSGALAVLKSRLPSMPMEVVQAVLLVSADPLGSRVNNPNEPDPVYGWGRLNLENAVTMQGTVHLPYSVAGTAATQAVPLKHARMTLPHALAQVGERLRTVEVAVGGVGDAYYNMKLVDAVDIAIGSPLALGYAARDLLAPANGYHFETGLDTHGVFAEVGPYAGTLHTVGMELSDDTLGRWRLRHDVCEDCGASAWREWGAVGDTDSGAAVPFFARAGGVVALQMRGNGVRPFAAVSSGRESRRAPWRQFGLRWRHEHDGLSSLAELSRVNEDRSVWGANFGALGDTRTETLQNRLFLSTMLGRDWRGFVGYEHSSGEVSLAGGMLSGVSGLRAEGWSAGTQGRNVFRADDILRFSVRQETGVRSGQARINHLVATGSSFVDAFYRGRPQSLERQQTAIDLRARPTTRYALGYGLPVGRNAQFALALEYEGESRDRGVSTYLRMEY